MVIVVGEVTEPEVLDADVFTSFAVRAWTDAGQAVATAMGDSGRPADEPGHVWVSTAWIRAEVHGDAQWAAGFDAMVDFAGSKGWLDADGSHILGHIETS